MVLMISPVTYRELMELETDENKKVIVPFILAC